MGFGRGRGASTKSKQGTLFSNNANNIANNNAVAPSHVGGNNGSGGSNSNSFGSSNAFGGSNGFGSGSNSNGFGSSGGNRGSDGCRKCGEVGHFARECPQAGRGGGGGGGSACRICHEDGHFAKECPNKGESRCFRCQGTGHMAADCTNEENRDPDRPAPVTYVPEIEDQEDQLFRQQYTTGINFDKYDRIPVKVTGQHQDKVSVISKFHELNIGDQLKRNIDRTGYKKPTPVQKYALPIVVQGYDLMACAQTGSGKTAAFVIPMIKVISSSSSANSTFASYSGSKPDAMVITPTRELAKQIVLETKKFSFSTPVKAAVAYGGVSVSSQRNQIRSGCNILIGTPGRLKMFINDGTVDLSNIKFLVLDEADRMLDMGFKEDIEFFARQSNMPSKENRQTLMFSATFPNSVQQIAREFLKNDYMFIAVGEVGAAQTDITQKFEEVSRREKNHKLKEIIREAGQQSKILVFVGTKKQADFLATQLSQEDFGATSIHGDRQQREREQALRDFSSGSHPILVATAVAARGLDIPGVTHVINYDIPDNIDQYTHQIGRTGRAGNVGISISFFDAERDMDIARSLVKNLSDAQQDVPHFLEEAANGMGAAGSGGWNNGGSNGWGGHDMRESGNSWNAGGGSAVTEDELW